MTVSWEVENKGQEPATGTWYDGVFLSVDQIWTPDDVFSVNLNIPEGWALDKATRPAAKFHFRAFYPAITTSSSEVTFATKSSRHFKNPTMQSHRVPSRSTFLSSLSDNRFKERSTAMVTLKSTRSRRRTALT